MARPNYGPGDHCQFNDYPQKISLVVGQKLASESGLFKEGQLVVLQQTPLSGQEQGDKVVGEELPKKAMIYTDTGEDDSFNLKIGYYGWGEFYLVSPDDGYYSLQITKGMVLQAGDWGSPNDFQIYYHGTTRIPSSKDINVQTSRTVSQDITEVNAENTIAARDARREEDNDPIIISPSNSSDSSSSDTDQNANEYYVQDEDGNWNQTNYTEYSLYDEPQPEPED